MCCFCDQACIHHTAPTYTTHFSRCYVYGTTRYVGSTSRMTCRTYSTLAIQSHSVRKAPCAVFPFRNSRMVIQAPHPYNKYLPRPACPHGVRIQVYRLFLIPAGTAVASTLIVTVALHFRSCKPLR